MKKTIQILCFVAIIGSLLFYGLVPSLVDHSLNHPTVTEWPEPSENAADLHQTLFVSDLHADSLLWGRHIDRAYNRGLVDLPRLQAGNMALQGFSVVTQVPQGINYESNGSDSDSIFWLGLAQAWPPAALGDLTRRALLQAERLHKASLASEGKLRVILSQADLRQLLADREQDPELVGGWLTLEGSHALEGDLDNLRKLEEAGFRMLAPTHFFDNAIGGSAHGLEKGGLTDLGREWVKEMDKRSLIIDLAHASPATFDEVLALTGRSVMVSHTGVAGTCPGTRNLTDAQLDALGENGGLVGIGFWEVAVCGQETTDIARAMDYVRKRIGVDHVALGSDFDGAVVTPVDAANMVQLTQALQESGWPEEDIRAAMGGNVRDFLLKNLPPG